MPANDIADRRGIIWRYIAGLVLLLLSPVLFGVLLRVLMVPYKDPRWREYKGFLGLSAAALEAASVLLLWGAAHRLRGWRYVFAMLFCCLAGALGVFFLLLALP